MTQERLRRVARGARESGLDAMLVLDLVNCRYLSGVATSNAAMVVGEQVAYVTDSRYETAVRAQAPHLTPVLDRDAAAGGVRAAAAAGVVVLGVEAHVVTVADWARLERLAQELGLTLVEAAPAVEALREVKDESELRLLREAFGASERALSRLLPEVRVGLTERQVAARLEYLMRDEGADAAAFPSIVATGSATAEPHHEPDDRVIEAGDLLLIDFGALVGGYHADMTRTFVVGAEPADWQREVHALVDRAAAAGRDAVRAGATGVEVDTAARAIIAEAGHGEHFGHGIGHGIGLRIHEAPMMGASSAATLDESMTVTVEPGVYLPGRGGVRIEDSLVVTADGADSLTTLTRELLVLG